MEWREAKQEVGGEGKDKGYAGEREVARRVVYRGQVAPIVGSDEAYFGLKLDCRAKTPSNRAIMLRSGVKPWGPF